MWSVLEVMAANFIERWHSFMTNAAAVHAVILTKNRLGFSLLFLLEVDDILYQHAVPEWAKACFRMAAARMALEQYEDAAVAAFEGLKIDDENAALKKIMKQAVAKGREAAGK